MAAQNPPYALQTGSHGSELFRRAVGSVLNSTGGVVGLSDLLVTQNGTPNMSVNVAGGRPGGEAWVAGSTTTGQGLYYVYNDGTVNLSIAAANATNPRVDAVYAQVQDATYAGTTNAWQLAVATGTPTAGATLSNLIGAGTVPASSLVLAYVLVPASSTSVITANIQDARVFARPNLPMRANPSGRIVASGTTSVLTSTYTQLALASTSFTKGGMTVSGNNLVVPISGYYQVSITSQPNSSSGNQTPLIYVNGVQYAFMQVVANSSNIVSFTDIFFVSAGQTIGSWLYQNSGSTVTTGMQNILSATLVSI